MATLLQYYTTNSSTVEEILVDPAARLMGALAAAQQQL